MRTPRGGWGRARVKISFWTGSRLTRSSGWPCWPPWPPSSSWSPSSPSTSSRRSRRLPRWGEQLLISTRSHLISILPRANNICDNNCGKIHEVQICKYTQHTADCPQHTICRLLFSSNCTAALQIILIETSYLICQKKRAAKCICDVFPWHTLPSHARKLLVSSVDIK